MKDFNRTGAYLIVGFGAGLISFVGLQMSAPRGFLWGLCLGAYVVAFLWVDYSESQKGR